MSVAVMITIAMIVGRIAADEAEFVADEHGVVDVSKQQPVGGSYKGISAMGLIWSMMGV